MSLRVALHHKTSLSLRSQHQSGPAGHPATPRRAIAARRSYRISSTFSRPSIFSNWQQDPQSNWLARVLIPEPTDRFEVTVDLVADLAVINPFDFFLEASAEQYPFAYDPQLALELAPYLVNDPMGATFDAYVAKIDRSPKPTTAFIFDLNAGLQHHVNYVIRMEPGVQTPDETLELASGSCRDSAWLLVQILRRLGLAGALCIRVLDPTQTRRRLARRTVGRIARFYRSARVVRSLFARRGLGRTRSDVGAVCGRRPHSTRVRGKSGIGIADFRHRRSVRGHVRSRDVGCARVRTAARHETLHR